MHYCASVEGFINRTPAGHKSYDNCFNSNPSHRMVVGVSMKITAKAYFAQHGCGFVIKRHRTTKKLDEIEREKIRYYFISSKTVTDQPSEWSIKK